MVQACAAGLELDRSRNEIEPRLDAPDRFDDAFDHRLAVLGRLLDEAFAAHAALARSGQFDWPSAISRLLV